MFLIIPDVWEYIIIMNFIETVIQNVFMSFKTNRWNSFYKLVH